MILLPSGEKTVTIVPTSGKKTRLIKDKTLKIRLDVFELALIDEIAKTIGYSERATAVRYCLTHFKDIQEAARIVAAHRKLQQAEKDFAERLTSSSSEYPTNHGKGDCYGNNDP